GRFRYYNAHSGVCRSHVLVAKLCSKEHRTILEAHGVYAVLKVVSSKSQRNSDVYLVRVAPCALYPCIAVFNGVLNLFAVYAYCEVALCPVRNPEEHAYFCIVIEL